MLQQQSGTSFSLRHKRIHALGMRRQEKMEVNLLVDLFSIKTPMKTAEKLGKE